MIRFHTIIALFFIILTYSFQCSAKISITRDDVREALYSLDEVMESSNLYLENRQKTIDSIRDSILQAGVTDELMLRLAERYTAFNNDSALVCLYQAIESPHIHDKLPFILHQASILPLNGFIETALRTFNSIPEDSVPERYKALYYDKGRQMYSYIAAFCKSIPEVARINTEKSLEMQQKLLQVLPSDSPEFKFNLGEYYFMTGEKGKARAMLEELINQLPDDDNMRARALHHLATMAQEHGDEYAYAYYLALTAIADMRAATREVAALQELGNLLYTKNDLDRAYRYLTEALADAVECGATLRMIESSKSLPIIERAKTDQLNAKQRTIFAVIAIMTVLVIGLIVLIGMLHREMKDMHRLQENLRRASRAKEVYIGQFLNLCSIYMDKLNQFCKIANRKIATGKTDELFRLTKSGKFAEEQSQEFYLVFDNAFLHLYPNFVSQVNALLRPDAQIELKEGEALNTDLRILAFMRLGVEESSRIAQVLNYSLNTIYAYRNRTKARAINRDTFEDDIMKINGDEG